METRDLSGKVGSAPAHEKLLPNSCQYGAVGRMGYSFSFIYWLDPNFLARLSRTGLAKEKSKKLSKRSPFYLNIACLPFGCLVTRLNFDSNIKHK